MPVSSTPGSYHGRIKSFRAAQYMTSPWYFSTGALFILVLKSNAILIKQINYVIRIF